MSESSSDIAHDLEQIHQLDAELSISTDASTILNENNNTSNSQIASPSNNNTTMLLNDDDDNISNINSLSVELNEGGNEKVSNFCAAFNTKVGVSTNTLEDVLEIVDILVSNHANTTSFTALGIDDNTNTIEDAVNKYKAKIEKLKSKNQELQNQLNQSQIQNSNLQASCDQFKYQNSRLEETLADVQQRLQRSQQEIKDLNDRTSRNNNTREVLEATVANLGDLIQSQLDDSTTIIAQRDSLIKIINKQNATLQQYEQILSQKAYNQEPITTQSNATQETSDDYSIILATLLKQTYDLKSNTKTKITEVYNDSNLTIPDRIQSIISLLIKDSNQSMEKKQEIEEDYQQLKLDNQDLQSKCIEILALFDEEIQFMQKLAHSTDIQNCIFFRDNQNGVIPFDQESKEELIQHCARVTRYIEETIPQLNPDEVTEAFSQFDSIVPTEIFDLLNPNMLEKKMIDFSSRVKNFKAVDKASIEIALKELYCLFAAQAFVNDILQNHAVELRMRYEINQREMQQLRIELEDTKEPIKSMKKIISHFTKRENKMKKLLSQVMSKPNDESNTEIESEIEQDNDLMKIVKDVAVLVTDSQLCQNERLQKELKAVIDEKELLTETLNKKIQEIENDLLKTEKAYQDQLDELNKTIGVSNTELDEEKNKNVLLNKQLEEIGQQLKEVTDSYNDLRSNQQNQIRVIQIESDNQIQSLSSQLELKLKYIKELEDKSQNMAMKIDDLRREKKEAKDRIEYLEEVNIKSVNVLKEKSKSLRTQCEDSIAEMQQQCMTSKEALVELQQENRNLTLRNEELAAELTNCQISKKSIELRAKALEDRVESTKQTLTSQFDAKVKSITTTIESKLAQIEEEQKSMIKLFMQYANTNLDAHLDIDPDIDLIQDSFPTTFCDNSSPNNSCCVYLQRFLRYLIGELESRHHSQVVYEETASDILKVQKLLKIPECQELFTPVSAIVKENHELKNKIKEYQDDAIENGKKVNDYVREIRKVESQIASLHQWESWARRVHRIVQGSCCTTYSSNQLRLSLEESLLSSITNRGLISKLTSLREEKKALIILMNNFLKEHDKMVTTGKELNHSVLFEGTPYDPTKPSWTSLIAICAFVRRIRFISGFISVDSQSNSASSLGISCGVVDTPKQKKKRNVSSSSSHMRDEIDDQPMIKPTALFKNI